ncbi:STAS domain-containing protein [Kitasatospora sp. NPDC050543]|uniref:STAS domain-containing protein n=1 Tax=Kitasatospora sp. NPDC050543 TaxID=3364054 RepID=UPI00378A8EA1
MTTQDGDEEQAGVWADPRLRAVTGRVGEQAVVCALHGEIDFDNHGTAEAALVAALDAGAPVLVVDLERLAFCDSSGLNLLLQARLAADRAGTELRLAAPGEQFAHLLEVTQASEVLNVYPTVAQALATA